MGNAPNAFDEVFSRNKPSTTFAERHPSQQDAVILWKAFHQRVNPFLRILFKRESKQLQTDAMHPEHVMQLTDAEHALIFSLYLISLLSLSDEDCRRDMHRPRSFLISELQTLCEEALSHTNLFCVKNITLLKAITIYLMAGIDRLSTQSLWSLMGLIVRNAEKLGIHRDGTHLGLTPFATEERRRLWWHLQHLDLALAVRSGLTPLTLMGDWDSKLPLNIEDDDINTNMTTFPEERKGLTDLSYCLFTYWVIDTQRAFLRTNNGRFELSWQSNEAVPQPMKDTLIGQLEEGLNGHFLQYCDPLKPVHMVLQILGRALICGMKQRSLQALICSTPAGEIGEDLRGEVMDASIQSLEYNNAFHSQPSIRHFRWLTNSFFPWHAFEASQQNDTSRTMRIWELLSEMYSANPKLSHLCDDDDRRVSHAARLVVAAWKTRHKKVQPDQWPSKPDFVVRLEAQLKDHATAHVQSEDGGARQQETAEQAVAPITPESILEEQVFNASFDLDFQDIDWSFWSSID
ncbi:MAG: hypothetical protein Q9202_003782 [Teloschistes flavicans]